MIDRFRFKAQRLSLTAVLLCITGFANPLHAAIQDRIRASIVNSETAELAQNVTPRARAAADLGIADSKLVLSEMTLRFSLTDIQQAALTELLLEQQQTTSANYHMWLTPEQFADQFGLSTTDLGKVTRWLSGQGFTVTSTARSRTFVSFSGTAAQVQQAFGTTIHNLSLDGEKHFANLTDPKLPSALAGVVTGITGLNDFKLVARAKSRLVPAPTEDALQPQFTSSVSGNHYIAPGDIFTIYDTTSLLLNSINGLGVTIAVMGQTDISLSDVAAFRAASGLSTNAPTVLLVPTSKDPGTVTNDLAEAQLDVEWSGAAAPSATILYVISTDVISGSLTYAIDNNLAPIISISYGLCESGWGQSNLTTYNQLFQQANAEGITIVSAAGDSGAADCDYQTTAATQGLAVDYPASSPYVTGLGGTMFNEGSGSYWSTSNNATSGSAMRYIPETVWNESSSSGLAAGGGGVSAFFSKPTWQTGTGVPADSHRDVPDVSLNAAASHDGYLICSSGSCVSGYRTSTGSLNVVGGTSVAAPVFAGFMALVEQKIAARVGNANPQLYALANSTYSSNVFHDITTGTNAVSCTTGTTSCATTGTGNTIGYSATTGYDRATGWGSVDAYYLVNDWLLVTSTGSGIGPNASSTTVTASPTNVVLGNTVILTAKAVSGVSTTTATPTGTIQFLVDGATSGLAVALSSGSATLSLATSSLNAGPHAITAVYSGDATYTGSRGTTTLTVTLATADFSLTPSASTITVTSGSSGSINLSLASLNSFAGSVTLSATTVAHSVGTFSANPVMLVASGTGTSTFTLSAVSSSAKSVTNLSSNRPSGSNRRIAGGGIAFASLLLLLLPRRRRIPRLPGLCILLLLGASIPGLSGCGNSGSTATSSTVKTTAGTYTITITATSGTLTHSTNITLVVQ